MNKKTTAILSAALLIAGGLILQRLYKKKGKNLLDHSELTKKGAKKMRKILDNAQHTAGALAHN